jgi:hypothetical protein
MLKSRLLHEHLAVHVSIDISQIWSVGQANGLAECSFRVLNGNGRPGWFTL